MEFSNPKAVEELIQSTNDHLIKPEDITHSNHPDPLSGDEPFGDFRDQVSIHPSTPLIATADFITSYNS
jgi:hypothetical protein